jgi:iron(III) transport system substrate-binding protein
MPDMEILRANTDFPIDYVIPEGGTPVVVDGIAVVRGTRSPELARAFVEYVGSREAALEAALELLPDPGPDRPGTRGAPRLAPGGLPRIRPMEADPRVIRERTPEWMRYWDSNIRRRGRALGYD